MKILWIEKLVTSGVCRAIIDGEKSVCQKIHKILQRKKSLVSVVGILLFMVAVGVNAEDWKSDTQHACQRSNGVSVCPILRDVKNSGSSGLNYVNVVMSGKDSYECAVFSLDSSGTVRDEMHVSSNGTREISIDTKSRLTTYTGGSYFLECDSKYIVQYYSWSEGS